MGARQPLPADLPPGIVKRRGPNQATGRYVDGDKVRFRDGLAQKIGGWTRYSADQLGGVPRHAHSWPDLLSRTVTAIGTTTTLQAITPEGNVDITPEDFQPLAENPSLSYGYGLGAFGAGTYGTPRLSLRPISLPSGHWSLANFGRVLLASPSKGTLFQWDPSPETTGISLYGLATPVEGAPSSLLGFFVTPERYVICYGAADAAGNVDGMRLRWCSQGDLSTWEAAPTNSANSRRLTEGRILVGGGAMGAGLSLVWSDSALYILQFTGSQFVYSSALAGKNCGLAGPHAFAFASGTAFWFGSSAFHLYNGTVSRIPKSEEVLEWVLSQLRADYEPKTFAFFNERYNEVWWFFVPEGDNEPSFYVAVNLADWSWTHGTLERTAHTNLPAGPLLTSADGWVFLHESGTDADGEAMRARIRSGIVQAGRGRMLTQVLGFIPDFAAQVGPMSLTLSVRDRPRAGDLEVGTVTIAPSDSLVDIRVRGRAVDFELVSDVVGGHFEMGSPSFDVILEATPR